MRWDNFITNALPNDIFDEDKRMGFEGKIRDIRAYIADNKNQYNGTYYPACVRLNSIELRYSMGSLSLEEYTNIMSSSSDEIIESWSLKLDKDR
ncbi:hypothetical protein KW787_03675 [Candidatus Pacearchaeota archaeon]|nr:hypothetical protein [Candidatus Pacearchaeota archaeon]